MGGQFADVSPDDLVAWQKANPGGYALLDLVQAFVDQKYGTYSYKRKIHSGLRSFFMHNRAALPPDPAYRIRGDKTKSDGTMSVQEFRQILASSNMRYRAMMLCQFQAGMGPGEVIYWSDRGLQDVLDQLGTGVRHIKIKLPGRKKLRNRQPYHTFIGRDATKALKLWLEAKPASSNSIFCNQFNLPINYPAYYAYFSRHAVDLGLRKKIGGDDNKGRRSGKSPHELRDLFRTRWEKSPAKAVAAEYFMGHGVDPLEYNKAYRDPDYALQQYIQAEPYLNIVTQDPTVVPRVELDQLKTDVQTQTEELLAQLKDTWITIFELQKELEQLKNK